MAKVSKPSDIDSIYLKIIKKFLGIGRFVANEKVKDFLEVQSLGEKIEKIIESCLRSNEDAKTPE